MPQQEKVAMVASLYTAKNSYRLVDQMAEVVDVAALGAAGAIDGVELYDLRRQRRGRA